MRTKVWPLLLALGMLVVFASTAAAQDSQNRILATYIFGDVPLSTLQNTVLPGSPIPNDRGILLGGIGSDLWRSPRDPAGEFWLVTDRGPNGQVRVDNKNRRTFPVPEFTPLILHVRTEGTTLTVLQAIPITTASGKPVTGLSNLEGVDETPYDASAQNQLAFNPNGLDTEGLVRTSTGDFWLADEYSPSLIRVDSTGRVVKRYVPQGLALSGADYPVADTLPAIYARRKGNRGFEGLAISPDERTLYITLQSPLSNPDRKTGEESRNGRILAFDIASARPVGEYVYQFEVGPQFDPSPGIVQDEMKLSGVVALNSSTLLVLERTDNIAHLYTVNLVRATNILGSTWDDPATTPALESYTSLADARITPLPKTLLVNLSALDGMPKKIEGVAVVDQRTLAVANDNDFDIGTFDANGRNAGKGVRSEVLLVQTPPIPGVGGPVPAVLPGTGGAASHAPAAGLLAGAILIVLGVLARRVLFTRH